MLTKGLIANVIIIISMSLIFYPIRNTKALKVISRTLFQTFGCVVEFIIGIMNQFVCYLIDNRTYQCTDDYAFFFCTDLILMWKKIFQWDF